VIKKQTFNRLAGQLAARYVKWVFRSSKSLSDIGELAATADANRPCIFAFWHGQFMLIPTYCPRHIPVANMVARHGDAELIGEVIKSFDQMTLIRGGGAGGRKKNRGGMAAFRAAVRALEEGKCVAMTADVPPGPARIAGQGVVKIAQMAGRPIIPVATTSSRFYALQTWSRMTINLPYSKIAMRLGDPIYVPTDADDKQLETLRRQVENALNNITRQVYEDVGADVLQATPYSALPLEAPPAPADMRLKAYKAVTLLMASMAPSILRYREKQGKEDPDRRPERLGIASVARPDGALTWLHAASVGETNAILPLLQRLHKECPGSRFLLTTGTLTSAKIARERLPQGDIHQFAPLDTPQFVARFLKHWRPGLALLTESEIWPNTILACHARGIPIAVVNGRMSERSYKRWRKNKSMAVPLFSRLHLVLAQNPRLVRQFRALGTRDVRHCSNIKIDAPVLQVNQEEHARLTALLRDRPTWAAASTHGGEDETIIEAHKAISEDLPHLMTIIAPRHPERGQKISELAAAAGITVARRSFNEQPEPDTGLYIIDTIGELGLVYSLAKIAFIGGSLIDHGGQNPIEAVRFETAVMTGPSYHNFINAYRALLNAGGALEVTGAAELASSVHRLLSDDVQRMRLARAANGVLENLSGGLEKTVEAIKGIIPDAGIPEADMRAKGIQRAS